MTETATPEHLQASHSARGFAFLPPIKGAYGGQVQVYESSAASSPHVWLATEDDGGEVRLHLTADDAWLLREQIDHLLANHYQGDARPETDGNPPAEWLIWSHEHGLWWAPDSCGYRVDVTEAGRYIREAAEHNCSLRSWSAPDRPPEVMVPAPTPELLASPGLREVMRQRVEAATTEAIAQRAARAEVQR